MHARYGVGTIGVQAGVALEHRLGIVQELSALGGKPRRFRGVQEAEPGGILDDYRLPLKVCHVDAAGCCSLRHRGVTISRLTFLTRCTALRPQKA